jgi:hypothetical protein
MTLGDINFLLLVLALPLKISKLLETSCFRNIFKISCQDAKNLGSPIVF